MNINAPATLALIADLYAQVAALQEENEKLKRQLAAQKPENGAAVEEGLERWSAIS